MKEMEIIEHELVPKHELLTEKEKEELLKRYGITLRQLPRIFASDPAIRHLNAKPGDVVKIIRKSETAGESIYYRVVIRR
ncbi:MAG: DNA-directed RNA polymerase subunit H [Candidatus Aenigmatarchaeota archaeon]